MVSHKLILLLSSTQIFCNQIRSQKNDKESAVTFSFTQKVTQNIIIDEPFNWATFFTGLGGSIGLWLGVGIVNILEILLTVLTSVFNKDKI